MNIITEYRKARADGATAQRALASARYNVRMAGVEFPRHVGDDVDMPLPRGERIVMRLEYDSDVDIAERFGATIDHCPARHAREYGAPDWWQDRDGIFHCFEAYDRFTVDLDNDSREWYRAHGMARHDAWLKARADRERAARAFRDASEDGYVGFIVTLYYAAGDEVDIDAVWGFEASGDYAGEQAYDVAIAMATERAAHWERETAKARNAMRAAAIRFRALADEIRRQTAARPGSLAALDAPLICASIRARLESLRADHRAALAVIVGGAA